MLVMILHPENISQKIHRQEREQDIQIYFVIMQYIYFQSVDICHLHFSSTGLLAFPPKVGGGSRKPIIHYVQTTVGKSAKISELVANHPDHTGKSFKALLTIISLPPNKWQLGPQFPISLTILRQN